MTIRSVAASVLLALLLAVSWSAVWCETSCVLPRDTHGCCAAPIVGGKSRLVQQQACGQVVRTVVAVPVLPAAATPGVVKAGVSAPTLFVASSISRTVPESPSPPKFNLRI
ncbi:MAG TPA: hypothetical protein VHT28_15110 [Silvibacterium sp.]|nr:hypothetical protein [Silvibacterium sp.]